MKYNLPQLRAPGFFTSMILVLQLSVSFLVHGQTIQMPGSGVVMMEAPAYVSNYTSFSVKNRQVDSRWLKYNPGQKDHPDATVLPPEQPASSAIEVLEKRTETTRFFVDADQPARVFSQSSYGPLHYQSGGKWLLIDHRLSRLDKRGYEASRQPEPTGFDTIKKQSYIRTANGTFSFNDWRLYGRTGKEKKLLAVADWKNHTAGDDGIFVTDIFPGVDAEMTVQRGQIKTNLIFRSWSFAEYTEVLLEDRFSFEDKLTLHFASSPENTLGIGDVELISENQKVGKIEKALAYAESSPESAIALAYELDGSSLKMLISLKQLKMLMENGTAIVDPRVLGAASAYGGAYPMSSFNGSSDNLNNCTNSFSEGCSYSWPLEIPARVTVTNLTFNARLETLSPCTRDKMLFRYRFGDGTCGQNIGWTTRDNPPTPGTTGGEPNTTDLYNSCLSSGCDRSFTNVHLSIIRRCMGAEGCGSECVRGIGPFVITVEGRTLELVSARSLSANQICYGESIQLAAEGSYGVPVYSYRWTPGNITGDTITVAPERNTNYTLTLTDACGQTLNTDIRIEVSPPPQTESVDLEDCGSVTFEGTEYRSSQEFEEIVPGRWGCDSIIRNIRIAVHPLDTKEESLELVGCEHVDFEGTRYFRSILLEDTFTNTNGCDSVYRKVNVVVEDFDLNLVSSVHPDSLFLGQAVVLTANSNRDEFNIISWEPAHLFMGQSEQVQQIRVPEDVTYTVRAETPDGCFDVATLRLIGREIPSYTLYPSSFSPNGDGKNDLWKPVKSINHIEVWVYNRWGECVYYSNEANHAWDGTYKGTKVPSGAYVFKFLAFGKFESSGVVNVIR